MTIKTSTHFLPPVTTGNTQSPDNRTMHQTQHGKVNIHVCDNEVWRYDNIKKDIDAGRYANLPPIDMDAWLKARDKRSKTIKARKKKNEK